MARSRYGWQIVLDKHQRSHLLTPPTEATSSSTLH